MKTATTYLQTLADRELDRQPRPGRQPHMRSFPPVTAATDREDVAAREAGNGARYEGLESRFSAVR
jgi:hypothetical protein